MIVTKMDHLLSVSGGFTYSAAKDVFYGAEPLGEGEVKPPWRYAVSVRGAEVRLHRRFPEEGLGLMLDAYMEANRDLLEDDRYCFGGWVDGDWIYLDCTILVQNLFEAGQIARDNHQLAIFDFEDNTEIRLDNGEW